MDEAGIPGIKVNCRKCNTEQENIKTLMCEHKFCRPCLNKINQEDSIMCPVCGKETKLSRGVDGLPSKFYYVNKTDPRQLKKKKTCAFCTDKEEENRGDAKLWCGQCKLNICEQCKEKHGQKFAGHVQISASEDIQCKNHDNEIQSLCFECLTCMCGICAVNSCGTHEQENLTDKSLSTIIHVAQEQIKTLEDAKSKNNDKIAKAEKDIDKSMKAKIQDLRNKRNELKISLDEQQKEFNLLMDGQIEKKESIIEELKLFKGENGELLTLINKSFGRLIDEDIKSQVPQACTFEEDISSVELGEIKYEATEPPELRTAAKNGLSISKSQQSQLVPYKEKEKKCVIS